MSFDLNIQFVRSRKTDHIHLHFSFSDTGQIAGKSNKRHTNEFFVLNINYLFFLFSWSIKISAK